MFWGVGAEKEVNKVRSKSESVLKEKEEEKGKSKCTMTCLTFALLKPF